MEETFADPGITHTDLKKTNSIPLRNKAEKLAHDASAKAQQIKESAIKKAGEFREVAGAKTQQIKQAAGEQIQQGQIKAREAHADAEEYVRQHPTKSVITALGVGFLIGLVIRR